MNIKEAFNILGVQEDISESDLKNKYKELAKKYHPDIYKEDPNHFKKINEAYQLVQDYRSNPGKYQPKQNTAWGNWGADFGAVDLSDLFQTNFGGGFNPRANIHPPQVTIDLTFKESILGCTKEIKYDALRKCEKCNGAGSERESNGCVVCNGFGEVTSRNGAFVIKKTCNKCFGKNIKLNNCTKCNHTGATVEQISGKIPVPPGTSSGTVFRLRGNGHFISTSHFGDSYSDALVHARVQTEKNMRLENNDVVSEINISLLDALKGTSKDINTVYDTKNVEIPAKTKNKEEIRIQGYGVKNTLGCHRVIISVDYPDNVNDLIKLLDDTMEHGTTN